MDDHALTTPRSRIVLVGGGHGHLYTTRRTEEVVRAGHDLILVTPDEFWYSGLATGVLAGQYPPGMDRLEVTRWVEEGGGRVLRERAVGLDAEARELLLAGGERVSYDVLSVNVGSRVPPDRVPGSEERAWPVKPIRRLLDLEDRLQALGRLPTGFRLLVVGGGATGCELALAAEARLSRDGLRGKVALVTRGRILEGFPGGVARSLQRTLEERSIRVVEHREVARVTPRGAELDDGQRIDADVVLNAAGLEPAPVVRDFGLPVNGDGALRVDEHLRSVADDRVFGVGDCASVEGRELPRVGVYAIRQAPVLHHNLLATVEGRPLERFEPQKRVLLILNLGDGTGLATWGPLRWKGRLAFRIKDFIDRRFLEKYRPTSGDATEEA